MACENCLQEKDFSTSNIATNGCPFRVPGDCIYYTGVFIPGINISNGDNFNLVVKKISQYLGIVVDDVAELSQILENTTTTSSTTTTTTTSGAGGEVEIVEFPID